MYDDLVQIGHVTCRSKRYDLNVYIRDLYKVDLRVT